jgi:hypothetical protein
MRRVVLAVLLVGCLCSPTLAQNKEDKDANNCHDQDAWTDWQERADRLAHDEEIQVLHALWMGLCFKVERGDIGFTEAERIFESARQTFIQQRREQNRGKKPPPTL